MFEFLFIGLLQISAGEPEVEVDSRPQVQCARLEERERRKRVWACDFAGEPRRCVSGRDGIGVIDLVCAADASAFTEQEVADAYRLALERHRPTMICPEPESRGVMRCTINGTGASCGGNDPDLGARRWLECETDARLARRQDEIRRDFQDPTRNSSRH